MVSFEGVVFFFFSDVFRYDNNIVGQIEQVGLLANPWFFHPENFLMTVLM